MSSTTSNRNYVLALLTTIVVFNYVDRLALGLVLQDIKLDLGLGDTQLGFLGGISFALFYAVMGIPIARWADRGNRVTIIALTTAVWSATVALCGAATSFVLLLLIRIGVAVGEAGCHPPAMSLLSDYFGRAERTRAVSRYLLGWPIALVVGNVAAGALNELYGWRMTFVVLGMPGLVLAGLVAFTLRDPRSTARDVPQKAEPVAAAAPAAPGLRDVFRTLWSSSSYRNLLFCQSLIAFFTYGILQWQPTFFVRSHSLQSGELGIWLAVVFGAGGLLGTYVGGELAFKYAANNEKLQLRVVACLFCASAVLMSGVYLASHRYLAFVLLALNTLAGAATNGPLLAATQALVPPGMRAMSVAIMLFFSNLIGMGFGPLAVGALSDFLRPFVAEESLRYALAVFSPGYLLCGWFAWRSAATACETATLHATADECERQRLGGSPGEHLARSEAPPTPSASGVLTDRA